LGQESVAAIIAGFGPDPRPPSVWGCGRGTQRTASIAAGEAADCRYGESALKERRKKTKDTRLACLHWATDDNVCDAGRTAQCRELAQRSCRENDLRRRGSYNPRLMRQRTGSESPTFDGVPAFRQNVDDRTPHAGRCLRVRRRHRKAQARRVRQPIERVAGQTIAIGDAKAGASEKRYSRLLRPCIERFDKSQMMEFTGDVHIGRPRVEARCD